MVRERVVCGLPGLALAVNRLSDRDSDTVLFWAIRQTRLGR
jgi:hypothetical protein